MKSVVFVYALLALSAHVIFQPLRAAAAHRPDQYVVFAFDGCGPRQMWEETRKFAAENPLKFTYFISGAYFLTEKAKKLYRGPRHEAGISAIGFGATQEEVSERVKEVNSAFVEGNEIGSHAVGHFDGGKWSALDWESEFNAFEKLLFGVFANNALQLDPDFPQGLAFDEKAVTGFRAPLLGTSPGLWPTLKKFGFRYDTSRTARPDYWPERTPNGFWNFPLAELTIAGTAKKTLSMDYNFYVAQSAAKDDVANSALYEQQMYETYKRYFRSNYSGNRAPIHIGHHFYPWNQGAYWKALEVFAHEVCVMPEVRCVTYEKLADFMDGLDSATLADYRNGNFEKAALRD